MASNMAPYVDFMNNKELIGLAQNRFTDAETQNKLAVHPYLRCRQYLAENPSLKPEARDLLLAGKATSVKWTLCSAGHLNHDPSLIKKVYDETPERYRQPWKVQQAFLSGCPWLQGTRPTTPINSPGSLVREIYEKFVKVRHHSDHHGYYSRGLPSAILGHPNCPEDIAVIASTSEDPKIRTLAFDALVKRKRSEKAQNLA